MEGPCLSRRATLMAIVATGLSRRIQAAPADDGLPEPGGTGEIRVCLTDNPFRQTAVITTATEATVTFPGEAKVRHRSPAGGQLTVARSNGVWSVAGNTLKSESLEIRSELSPGLWVNNRFYRGAFSLVPFNREEFWIVNTLPLEHYLCAVVDGEIPGAFHNEARKAQAVAARTYAISRRLQNAAKEFDVYASPTRDQNYHGYQYRDAKGRALAGESAKSRQAVRETIGRVLLRDGKLSRTYYSACCGGQTSAGTTIFADATEMRSVECGHCSHCPRYRWTATLTSGELASAVRKAIGKDTPKAFAVTTAGVEGFDDRTRLPRLVVQDHSGMSLTVDTRSFRSALSRSDLLSTWFSISNGGDRWKVAGMGHGHGIGMCQWGADGFAKEGKRFDEILRHYYPGAVVAAYER